MEIQLQGRKNKVVLLCFLILLLNCKKSENYVVSFIEPIPKKELQKLDYLNGGGFDKEIMIIPLKKAKDRYEYKFPFHDDDFFYYEPSYILSNDTLIINLKIVSHNFIYLLFVRNSNFEKVNPKFFVFNYFSKREIVYFKIIIDVYPYQ